MKKSGSGAIELTEEQQSALVEWRNLCFALERSQAENLVENCQEKFQFAKTYLVYGRDLEKTVAEITAAAGQGNYSFLVKRGIRGKILTPQVVAQMVIDWRGAIASKKARLAEVFQGRFNEDIEHFIATPHNASRLIMANSFDETDAILSMMEGMDWNDKRMLEADVGQVRADLSQIQRQLDELRSIVEQIREVTRRLDTLGPSTP